MGEAHEEPLSGGNTHDTVVRLGATVRRPTGVWTPGVHALLRHLEEQDFAGAPRVLGTDEQGREMLTYVDGRVVWPDHFDLVAGDAALGAVARVIRGYHDAVAGFAFAGYDWSDRGNDPRRDPEILCHNDLAPWNLIATAAGWTFIDWDLAAPGRRAWDLGWAVLSFVPLTPAFALEPDAARRRVAVFSEAYGLDAFPADTVEVAYERAAHEAATIRVRGARGEPPFDRLLADGHAEVWTGIADAVGGYLGGD
jgi:aminoglycoside phosphotransferase (APT) family kinase protein